MKKFIKFLEDNNAWKNFEKAFIESGTGVEEYKAICKKDMSRAINAAFTWEKTKEGYVYWSGLNRKWFDENKTLKEKLLNND
nr:MAG TPA: hypothetical protein [Microviridae sp.]